MIINYLKDILWIYFKYKRGWNYFSLFIRQQILFILGTNKNKKLKKYIIPPFLLKQVINLNYEVKKIKKSNETDLIKTLKNNLTKV